MNDLIKRLRDRAKEDRQIQSNNEAVATALQGQRLLFDQGFRSQSNTFAVRLALDYERCAKKDAELAADWEAAADRIEELVKERDEALRHAQYHEETLDAWFDRRELGHAAVDQAVVDAASGYLRTARAGGMTKKQSDMILGVIQDMARLGLFADLFARATLADLEGEG